MCGLTLINLKHSEIYLDVSVNVFIKKKKLPEQNKLFIRFSR